MKKKIISILLCMLFFTSVLANCSTALNITNKKHDNKILNTTENEQSDIPTIAFADLNVQDLYNILDHFAIVGILHKFVPYGDCKAEYSISFDPLPPNMELDGWWKISIYVGDIELVNDQGSFNYKGDSTPENISEKSIKYIPISLLPRIVKACLEYSVDIYVDGEFNATRENEIEVTEPVFFPKTKIKSPFTMFMFNHPFLSLFNRFPLLLKLLSQQ